MYPDITQITMAITSGCNLECPCCPSGRGNYSRRLAGKSKPLEYMPLQLCQEIFEKVFHLYGSRFFYLHLFDEPLLHPDISAVLECMEHYGHTAHISTNGNVHTDFKSLMHAKALKSLAITISGMHQEIYAREYRGGNIDIVLHNLEEISKYTQNSHGKAAIKFHEYTYNARDKEALQKICQRTGIAFWAYPAMLFCQNVVLQNLDDDYALWKNDADIKKHVIRGLPYPPFPFTAMHGLESVSCVFQKHALVLDHRGQIGICNFYEPGEKKLGFFLDLDAESLAKKKQDEPVCMLCRKMGLHMQLAASTILFNPCSMAKQILDFLSMTSPAYTGKIYLFGAGQTGSAFAPLLRQKGYTLCAFIDDDSQKIGKTIDGIKIISWQDADLQDTLLLDTVYQNSNLKKRLEDAGICACTVMHIEEFVREMVDHTTRGHRGGNVNLVLRNLEEIEKYAKDSSVQPAVKFHEYKDNDEDKKELQKFCSA